MKILLQRKLWTLYYKLFLPKHYISIHDEGSAYVWDELQKKQDYSILFQQKVNLDYINSEKIILIWESIYNEFIAEFPNKKYFEELELKKKIAIWRYRAESYGEKHLRTRANLEELKLEAKKTKNVNDDFMKNLSVIEKHLGIKINYLKISIFEYNNYLRVLSEQNGK